MPARSLTKHNYRIGTGVMRTCSDSGEHNPKVKSPFDAELARMAASWHSCPPLRHLARQKKSCLP